ncbi:MAG: hypothetical protein OZSIB_4010 [Candidatus Ozemobacter sibiricus]|jgi:hypothetical protein|uniref:Uncharacterized protein n=1 Tax=Candidatus Ozemobacter sibiricus TaxID=2268124 RepID=A0A367ZP97_9BACT|nr:MAG: hypothetical protein OZSIB_4010 [Candidatus Ozemobacter sibiricus]
MDEELKTLAEAAFWNFATRSVSIAFWALFGPFAYFFFAVGILNGVVLPLFQKTWLPPMPPLYLNLITAFANFMIYVFVIQVILYETYNTSKDAEGLVEGTKIQVVLFAMADLFIINQVGLSPEILAASCISG